GLLVTTTLNLMIAGGRAGLLGFMVLLGLLMFQRFAKRPVFAAAVALLLAGGIVAGGYLGSDFVRQRMDDGIDEVMHYEERV
ncbi:hypothetical protein, partial [Vibrio vulnificus]|uniref:hypothetical protein n=1 Tax=Vibrio vulnificus TaxID=672 RepID=UPI0039B64053